MLLPKVYIAGPITRGDLKHNVDQATEAFVALALAGFAPMCPHWSVYAKPTFWFPGGGIRPEVMAPRLYCHATAEGNHRLTYEHWMALNRPWVLAADALLRLPGESTGAALEEEWARGAGLPVFASIPDLIAHFAALRK